VEVALFCPSCGKPIPDESKFCLHCGTRVQENSAGLATRNTPPIALEIQLLRLAGATEINKGKPLIGRGFEFNFSLFDSDMQFTTSDGELIAALLGANYPNDSGEDALPSDIKMAREVKKQYDTRWNNEISIKAGDFKWKNYHTYRGDYEALIYRYLQISPLLFIPPKTKVNLHIWFITSDGKCFYKTGGGRVTWEA
jgi:hypothetical protein